MATRTVSQTGNLSNAATFGGSAFSDGDSIVNDAGNNFVLTIDQNATVAGFSGTGGNGETLVNSGVTLTLTGNVVQGNKPFTLGSGTGNAHLVFDCTAANRKFLFGDAASFTTYANCKLVVNGTSGAHCTITKTGSNFCWFDDFSEGSGAGAEKPGYDCTWCDFSGITTSDGSLSLGVNSFGAKDQKLDHCTFDGCGVVFKKRPYSWGGGSNKSYYIRDCRFTNSTGSFSCEIMADGSTGTGAHDITRNACDIRVNYSGKMDLVDNLFERGVDIAGIPISNEWNLYQIGPSAELLAGGSSSNCYWLAALDHTGNPHCLNGVVSGSTVSGWIFEYPLIQQIDSGELVYNSSVGTTGATVRNCIALPSETDGKCIGAMVNAGFTPQPGWVVEHCTVYGENASAIVFWEGIADQGQTTFDSLKSNLAVDPVGNNANIVYDSGQPTNAANDQYDPADADYNGMFGEQTFTDPVTGAVRHGYRNRLSSGTPGANDIIADPQFVDPTRHFASWPVFMGVASSGDSLEVRTEAGMVLLRADPTLIRTSLIPYVRGGFAPTNPVYQNAGHDGVTTGAVEGVFGGGSGGARRRRVLMGCAA